MQNTENTAENAQLEQDQDLGESTERQADELAADEPDLAEKLAQAQMKITELEDLSLRATAEAENVRRRAQEDISRAHKFAVEGFAQSLLPAKDSLEMALQIETPSVEALKEGVEMTLKQLSAAFEKYKLLEIHPQSGAKLDPMQHQAISTVPAAQEHNTIVSVVQKGYTIADRLLRPALVTVAVPAGRDQPSGINKNTGS